MRRVLLAGVSAVAMTLATPALAFADDAIPPVAADAPLVASMSDTGDPAADLVLDPPISGDMPGGLSHCGGGSRSGRTASITYSDLSGQPVFKLAVTISYSWDCKVVLNVSHTPAPYVYAPEYSFAGYLKNTETPENKAVVTVDVQGRFGICTGLIGSTERCLNERDPDITWTITAAGKATPKMTP